MDEINNNEIKTEQPEQLYPDSEKMTNTKEEKIVIQNIPLFTAAAALYALFYTFCLYKNSSGITSPFFAAGTLYYLYFCIKKFGVPLKKDACLYAAAIVLLGISNFLTGDGRIIAMNYTGIFLLIVSFMLHIFYEDSKWSFSKYFMAIGSFMLECIVGIFRMFSHYAYYYKNASEWNGKRKVKYVALGILVSIPLLLVIMVLLTNADRIFRDLVGRLLHSIAVPQNLLGILVMILFIFIMAYGVVVALARRSIPDLQKDFRTQEPVIANTFTILLSAVYMLFCAVQIGGLFLGAMKLPDGYSYSGYAREGFFQLLTVCVINLGIVLICLGYFKEHKLLKLNLTIISACTYIMIASSAYRMVLYIKEYNFTFLRLFVLWSLALISVIMAGIIISIYRNNFPFFRFTMTVVTVFYLFLSFSHPDYWIARYNYNAYIEESETEEYENCYPTYGFLKFSSDAAPVILSLKENYSSSYNEKGDAGDIGIYGLKEEDYYRQFNNYYNLYIDKMIERYQNMNLRDFNLSRYIAGKLLE